MNVRETLFEAQDLKYKDFHKKLVPVIDENRIIGVRIPMLRKIAKSIESNDFDWYYYEEIMLHGFHIGYGKYTFDERLKLLDSFIPRIDNWAVCDSVASTLKFINSNKSEFLNYLSEYFNSSIEYEVRFAIVILMDYYLDDKYIDFCIEYFSSINSEYYYVNMAAAWALSVAFVKYQDKVMKIIESNALTPEVHNMTLSKIRDSLRVDKGTKKYLKSLKR